MTIHWKALEKHFLMEPLVFQFNHFLGQGKGEGWEMHFLNFSDYLLISHVIRNS
jgi:hypothetical protein